MNAPTDYRCPFCALARREAMEGLISWEESVFYRDGRIMAFVSSHTWPGSEGNAIIVPVEHYEGIYDMPDDLLADIAVLAGKVARLYKSVFAADGVTVRQHNDPAGNQDVWHYHLHVMPRTEGVSLYLGHLDKRRQTPEDRDRVVAAFRGHPDLAY